MEALHDKVKQIDLKEHPEGRPRHSSITSFATLEQESSARATKKYAKQDGQYILPQHVSRWDLFQGKKAASGTEAVELPRPEPNVQFNAKGRKIVKARRALISAPKGEVGTQNSTVESNQSEQKTCKVFEEERPETVAELPGSSLEMATSELPGAYSMNVVSEDLEMHLDQQKDH